MSEPIPSTVPASVPAVSVTPVVTAPVVPVAVPSPVIVTSVGLTKGEKIALVVLGLVILGTIVYQYKKSTIPAEPAA